jgi:hypothetical protein
MTTLCGNVYVNGENIRNSELRKQQQVIGIDEINLHRTSTWPVIRREDFLW